MDLFHVVNRGVDKRTIVLDEKDKVRFLHDLFVFNDVEAVPNFILSARHEPARPRKLLVYIHAFCLMPNHYHLLLSAAIENGIPLFMKKLNMGYAKYFNEKYSRSGALWQGKYKKKLIAHEAHFQYIPYYIHLNALDLCMPQWREGKVRDIARAMRELKAYRWSSHLDYLGEKNFPSITQREFLAGIIGTRQRYEKEIAGFIGDPSVVPSGMTLE